MLVLMILAGLSTIDWLQKLNKTSNEVSAFPARAARC
jgi:hypothetical protein